MRTARMGARKPPSILVAPSLQLVVEVVEHDVGQER